MATQLLRALLMVLFICPVAMVTSARPYVRCTSQRKYCFAEDKRPLPSKASGVYTRMICSVSRCVVKSQTTWAAYYAIIIKCIGTWPALMTKQWQLCWQRAWPVRNCCATDHFLGRLGSSRCGVRLTMTSSIERKFCARFQHYQDVLPLCASFSV